MTQTFAHGYALLIGVTENQVARWALPDVAKDITALSEVLAHPERCAYPAENSRHRGAGGHPGRASSLGWTGWKSACAPTPR